MEQTKTSQTVDIPADQVDTPAGRLDTGTALVGGGGVALVALTGLLPPGAYYPLQPALGIVAAAVGFAAFAALAFGIRRASARRTTGLVGTDGLTRWCLFSSGALTLAAAAALLFTPTDPDALFAPSGRIASGAVGAASYGALLALLVAAVSVTWSDGAWRTARIGVRVLAAIALAQLLLPLTLLRLDDGTLQTAGAALMWVERLFALASLAVGVSLAWPWLAPRVDRLAARATAARDRWIDSTP